MIKNILVFILLIPAITLAQTSYTLSGKVTNEKKEPLTGAYIAIHENQSIASTNESGYFEINNLKPGTYHLHISYLGYKCVHYNIIEISYANVYREFNMQPDDININEVTVRGNSNLRLKLENSANIELANKDLIRNNLNSSLMKSIESLGGVSAIEVGQGFSKPVIRGLSFNRVAVTENGIKQEGQQWGADHGLEIDQHSVERIEIIKGPASLAFGSDAIGGVIQIMPNSIPANNTSETEIRFMGKSLNYLYGFTAMNKLRKDKLHTYFRITNTNFGDYSVPADSFFYNRYKLPLYQGKLKNTAGTEKDLYFTLGWLEKPFKTTLSISNVNSKVGFFPGSHGLPDAKKLLPDGNSRNIDLPFQSVNHFKIIGNSKFYHTHGSFDIDMAYQNNMRQEWSVFHTHYPNQKAPEISPNLELEFLLNTFTAEAKYNYLTDIFELSVGSNLQFKYNFIGGYSFLLPEYSGISSGTYLLSKFNLSDKLILSGGIRYDAGSIHISPYFSIYSKQFKADKFSQLLHDFSWAAGANYNINNRLSVKLNTGKSFRMPTASELSANGIHHGSFRYEVGDTAITSEYSYQIDLGTYFHTDKFEFELSSFINYFPNFIYLKPTGSYLHPNGTEIEQADAGQVFQYIQSEAFRAGAELTLNYKVTKHTNFKLVGEYVYATDFTYPIPFTPPLNILSEISYAIPNFGKIFSDSEFKLTATYSGAQKRIARNESATPEYFLVGFSAKSAVKIAKFQLTVELQGQNLLNTVYYNHLSFYRLIDLPEAGRNFQVAITIPIFNTL